MAFTHLHLHTQYSLLDGACRIADLIAKLKQLNMKHCAITDHGVMYGVVDFYEACLAEGIHPIIGCEAYVCKDMNKKDSNMRDYRHIILLCKNNTGYKNLTKLVSKAFVDGYYYKPRFDYKILEEYSEGLICLTACINGELPQLLLTEQYEQAKKHALYMQSVFGKGNYYIELMNHGIDEEEKALPRLISLAKELDIPMVATNDCHYINREDADAQEVLMCIQTGKTLDDTNRMHMETDQLYIKNETEMRELFNQVPEAIENTEKIAEMCNVSFDFNTYHLPQYPIETSETAFEMLKRLCLKGLKERYPDDYNENSKPYARLQYEMNMINTMGYVDYFLIVWDFINYSRENNIMVGPGRGSGAGSIVAYTLYITALDPLKYNLLFERFLNPERMSMPDLDIDFCYERRQEVIDYVTRKYGEDHVSQIITFGTMAARAVIRDVGRVLGVKYGDVDKIAKMIPAEIGITLEKAMQLNPKITEEYNNKAEIKKLIDFSKKLEGMPRHTSTHAAGVLITGQPVTDYVPLQKNDDVITTQFPMNTLEHLGLLKMDFLGLRTLTVIRDALELLPEGAPKHADNIPLDDPKIYKMISNGDTDGVFQLEGSGMRAFLTSMKPESFEDIIAAISLYRPGPMDSIPRYIKGKNDASTVEYSTEKLRPILDVTYGCMVYQEQVMQIVRDLAGYSLGRSDLMRRAMSKKKKKVMAQEREYFVHGMKDKDGNIVVPGCVRNGVPANVAEKIYDEMSSFASYAFNKSHAAAYGVLSVYTAWLKYYYPVQFMAAIMNSIMGNSAKVAGYIQYCREQEISVLPPNINKSNWKFSVDIDENGNECVRFGLGGIKNVGHNAVRDIMELRNQKKFENFADFINRSLKESVNKRTVESLIKCGAFDEMKYNRAQLLSVYEKQIELISSMQKRRVVGQMSLFDSAGEQENSIEDIKVSEIAEYPHSALLTMEKEITGVYISGHPLDDYKDILKNGYDLSADILALTENEDRGISKDGMRVHMAGILASARSKSTKKGSMMAFITLEDLRGQIEGLVFPTIFTKYADVIVEDNIVEISGKISFREEEEPKLLVDSVKLLNSESYSAEDSIAQLYSEKSNKISKQMNNEDIVELAKKSKEKLYVKIESKRIKELKDDVSFPPGKVPVYVKFSDTGKTIILENKYWCSVPQGTLDYLKSIYGKENVIYTAME